MNRIEAVAATDQGQVRPRNEDAYCVGDNVFAVADGMGGHLAGDVASTTALMPIQDLDGRVFADASNARAVLLDAVLAANAAVVRKAANEPNLEGMGTTLTATIVEGHRLHVGHVGDSRAYLLRDDQFVQLTRDHTLVAHLIEQGRLRPEEATSHPRRSVVTRAVGLDVDLDVDTLTIELEDGDQVLLCSDGLTGPVGDEEIRDVLGAGQDAQTTVSRLVDAANARGGPDNITAVLLRFEQHSDRSETSGSTAAVIRPDQPSAERSEDWARTVGRLGSFAPSRSRDTTVAKDDDGGGRWRQVVAGVGVGLLLLALAVAGGRWLLSRSYFVGLQDRQVTIYHGVPISVGPVELYWVAETTGLDRADVADWYVRQLEDGVTAVDRTDANQIVDNAPRSGADPPADRTSNAGRPAAWTVPPT